MEYLLRMENIEKSFPGVQVLKNISLKIRPGEVHALIGENGAGKSTLMKILSGVLKDSGEIFWMDEKIDIRSGSGCPYAVLRPFHRTWLMYSSVRTIQ